MSVQAMVTVFHQSETRLGTRLVMLAIANYYGEDGAWPSVERLAKDCRLSVRQVQRCLHTAEDAGELEVEYGAGPNGTNHYTLRGVSNRHPVELGPEMSPKPKELSSGVVSSRPKDAAPNGAPVNDSQTFVPDRWPYFLVRLAEQDPAWSKVTVGACVKIAKGTSVEAVSTALSFASVNAPILTGSAYGWLEATAKGLHGAAVGA